MVRKYPSLFLLCFVAVGIVLADQLQLSSWWFLALALLLGLTGLIEAAAHRSTTAAVALGCCLMFLSAFHFAIEVYDTGPRHIAAVVDPDTRYHIYGRVADWPEFRRDRTEIVLALDSIISDRRETVTGSVLLRVNDTTTALQRGDRIEFWARIYPLRAHPESGEYDYGRFLNLRGVFGLAYLPTLLDVRVDKVNRYGVVNIVDRLRAAITESFEHNLSPQAGALASGFLIGETRNIPTELYTRFRDSGTLHVLAVSGSNVALVLLFLVFLLKPLRLSRVRRSVILLSAVGLFALLSYGEPSVIRASLMASLVIMAQLLDRRYDLNNIISLTALTILLVDPAQFFGVGFQLSFAAAWGLILLTPPVHGLFPGCHGRWWYRWLVFPLIISVVAQLCSAPLIAYYFHRVPLLSVAANLVIVPLVSVAVVGVLLLLLADLIWPLLGFAVGSLLTKFLDGTVYLLHFFGAEQMPTLNVRHLPAWAVCLFYGFVVTAVWAARSKPARRLLVFAMALIAVAVLGVGAVRSTSRPNDYEVRFFTVPGGLAAVVSPSSEGGADLVIANLDRRDYEIDDVIIAPLLDRLGIDKLRSLLVLDADYGALDDIVRLAVDQEADCLGIDPSLVNSARDAAVGLVPSLPESRIRALNPSGQAPSRPGYYPSRLGLRVVLGGRQLFFAGRTGLDPDSLPASETPVVLVVGGGLMTSPADLARLKDKGYSPIICSKVTVGGVGGMIPSEQASQPALPDFVYDLNRLGDLGLGLRDGAIVVLPTPVR
jgi:ComEC/Rec2-related protein